MHDKLQLAWKTTHFEINASYWSCHFHLEIGTVCFFGFSQFRYTVGTGIFVNKSHRGIKLRMFTSVAFISWDTKTKLVKSKKNTLYISEKKRARAVFPPFFKRKHHFFKSKTQFCERIRNANLYTFQPVIRSFPPISFLYIPYTVLGIHGILYYTILLLSTNTYYTN